MDDLLPVGSVVRLKQDPKFELMIAGYYQEVDDVVYDYVAVIYPNGMDGVDSLFVFQQSAIESVIFEGYKDEEGEAFTMMLPKLLQAVGTALEEENPGESSL